MYILYLRMLRSGRRAESSWLSAVMGTGNRKPVLKWYDKINLERKNVDAFAAWTEIQCAALGVDFGNGQIRTQEKTK